MVKLIMVKYKTLKYKQKQSPTGSSGATSLPPIGDSFTYRDII